MSWGTSRKAALTEPRWKKTSDAEAGDAGDRVGKVQLLVVLEGFALVVVEIRRRPHGVCARPSAPEALHRSILPLLRIAGGNPGRDVDVGSLRLHHPAQLPQEKSKSAVTPENSSRLVRRHGPWKRRPHASKHPLLAGRRRRSGSRRGDRHLLMRSLRLITE